MSASDARVAALLGATVARSEALHGGDVAEVRRVTLADGRVVVAKRSRGTDLTVEAFMLGELARLSRLPVPAVLAVEPDLLVMEHVEAGGSPAEPGAQRHAAALLADLHAVRGPAFGFERATLIGPLPQPNPWTERWLDFFRDQRLLAMTARARASGNLPGGLAARLERLAGRLDRHLAEPPHPSLLHGDLWTGNVLARGGRITGFVDPAVYYGHPEIELAFSTLFGTFGGPFFARYRELAPLEPGFLEERRDLYNLYPLLVHVTLFGAGYLPPVARTLDRLGV